MARIRTIKPEFFRHEGLQDLEMANPGCFVMLVFAALWGHCDKAGRFEWKPRTLKLDILPFLDFDLGRTLALLGEAGFVRKYEHEGKQYGEVVNFEKHQRIGGKEAQDSAKHPEPPGKQPEQPKKEQGSTGEAPGKQLGLQEGKGRERKEAPDGADVWDFGIEALKASGLGDTSARRFLGSLCKTYDDSLVLDAMRAATGKADPKSYACKWLEGKPKRGAKPPPTAEPDWMRLAV